jgi:hypothetical protein
VETELTQGIGNDTPLRLAAAAKLAFPGGGMSESGLRREAKRGKLVIERIAGKDYTTLNHIKRMREQCRARSSRPDSTSSPNRETSAVKLPMPPSGLSLMEVANSELAAALTTSKARSKH